MTWGETAGKVDRFPLADEGVRAMSPQDDLAAEVPLLLDPCRDDPENKIVFDVRGDALAVGGSRRGKTTIKVMGLKRKALRDARKKQILLIQHLIARLVGKGTDAQAARDTTLEVMAEPHCPFAGVARAMRRDPAAFGI